MIAEQLRKSILQAAIQGKLTEQLPEDGDARELLKEIQKEKQRLISEGKIKKEKHLPEITEEEIPFEIPANWCWVRLGDISWFTDSGKSPKCEKSPVSGSEWGVLTTTSIQADMFDQEENKRLPSTFVVDNRIVVKEGDLLITRAGPTNRTGISCIVDSINKNLILSDKIVRVQGPFHGDEGRYISLFINSPSGVYQIRNMSTGMDKQQVNISQDRIKTLAIALPPPAEQRRIINLIREIAPPIDVLRENETELDVLLKSFPKKMKDAVLQAAIQGKLTEQLPEDGDARDLLKEIQKEKQRLIKEGKIKKDKPLPEIIEDEIPFDIPANWCWVRLNDLLELGDGKNIDNAKYPYLDVKYLRGSQNCKLLSTGKFIDKNSKVILVDGENSGEVFTVQEDGYLGSTFKKLIVIYDQIWPYLDYFLKKQQERFKNNKTGSAIPHLNKKLFREMLVPLPPFSEQHKIVERLNQLLPLCDVIERLGN